MRPTSLEVADAVPGLAGLGYVLRLGTCSHPNGHSHSQVGCLAPFIGRLRAGTLLHRLCPEVCLTLLLHGLL